MVITKFIPDKLKIKGTTLETGNLSMYIEFGSFQGKALEIDSRHTIEQYLKLSNEEKLAHQKIIRCEKPIIGLGTKSTEDLILSNADIFPDRFEYTEDELNALAGIDLSLSSFLNNSLAGDILKEIQTNLNIRYHMQEISMHKNNYSSLTWDTILDIPLFYTIVGYNPRNSKYWTTLIKKDNEKALEEDIIDWQLPASAPKNSSVDYQYVSAWELSMWAWNLYLLNQIRAERSLIHSIID